MEKTCSRRSILHQSIAFAVTLIALFAIVAVLGDNDAYAYTIDQGDFSIYYREKYGSDPKVYENIEVKSYTGSKADVTLPAEVTINGTVCPVTKFSEKVFSKNEAITSVTIPENYTDIPASAFEACTGLKSVNVPGSVTMIGSNAFKGCTALETLTFDADTAAALSIGNGICENCMALQSVELPSRITSLDNNIFFGCTALKNVTVRAGGTFFSENNMVFERGETSATLIIYPFGLAEGKVELPAAADGLPVTATGAHTFRNCASITEVTIPASYKTIERFAFNNCSKLMTVNVLSEEAITLGSNCFIGMPAGSVINVPNETVAAGFEPDPNEMYASPCYTPENTTVTVKAAAPKTVEAALTLEAVSLTEAGEATFDVYLDSASCLSTIVAKFTYDPAQFSFKSAVKAGDIFDNVSSKTADGSFELMFNKLNNVEGYTGSEPVKIATITMTKQADATGHLALTLSGAKVSGVTDTAAPAAEGTAVITKGEAEVFAADYDVNNDGKVNQVDITEAQRFYQETSAGSNWEKASEADVNGDGQVDLEDLIAIFFNLAIF